MSRHMSTTPVASQPGMIDPLMESLIDFSDYDNVQQYQSPSLSPATSSKAPAFARPIKTEATPSLLPTTQPLSGPSHQYDLYKQQTGMVPGALASTLAVNQSNALIHGYTDFGTDYLGIGNTDDGFDFNTAPSQGSMGTPEMDMDFDSPTSDPFGFDATVNPSSIGGQEPSTLPSPPVLSTQTRLWPGAHQQAALKAQAQAQQQRRQRAQVQQAKQSQRPKHSQQPNDPLVEQKITQLLNSMRAKPSMDNNGQVVPHHLSIARPKKDEEDMDEDERLLASEEGKKLSSKERRQLRNKVSARAFRSRRKEYITQLESEIANKVNENGILRTENRALTEEVKRLTDLTHMLLSSPSFSDFLDRLSANPQQIQQSQPAQPQQQETGRQARKDANPYAALNEFQHQQIGVAMMPEQPIDFSTVVMDSNNNTFSYQPQVFAVLNTPEPTLDASILSGKPSLVDEQFDVEEEKVEMPIIERPAPVAEKEAPPTPVDEQFENDPAFALYHDSPATETKPPVELDTEGLSDLDIFGGIEPEKVLARYELVNVTEEDAAATLAMARVQRISANLECVRARLESLTVGL
ncbi:hypothetical protein QBC47DRAFT_402849 [Echria macrotheca]|uniref:BZIP domain-containing protein n=1 Tax=Echria macrotheca TaxID=438768 RepID=A0AAJ0B9Z7_9PEZI|nr:hypothetical protein QBC47DRAFT_402849 [Echria macrotheca]